MDSWEGRDVAPVGAKVPAEADIALRAKVRDSLRDLRFGGVKAAVGC
jgi:hypothetical protein